MVRYGVDYSSARPDLDLLVTKGITFVSRYLPVPNAIPDHCLTPAEVTSIRGHGLDLVANYEVFPYQPVKGAMQGRSDGIDAVHALRTLGFPKGTACYVSIDINVVASELPAIRAYVEAFRQVLDTNLYRTGIYSGNVAYNDLLAHNIPVLFWQSAALAWSSPQTWDARAVVQQRGLVSIPGTDGDMALVDDFGQWRANNMIAVVTVKPFDAPRHFTVAANTTLSGYDPATPGAAVKTIHFATPSGASADAEVNVSWVGQTPGPIPRGGPFLRVITGSYKGLLIVEGLVTLDPLPPVPQPSRFMVEASVLSLDEPLVTVTKV